MSVLGRGLGVIARREFWNFRTMHAFAGAALTVAGAGEALFVNEQIKKEVAAIDGDIAAANRRQSAIDQALFQFRFAQINGITLGVLSANDSVRPEFRSSLVELMFVSRRMPTEIMLQQIYANDAAGFAADRQAYIDLIEAAKDATNQADWEAVNAFEFERESRLFDIQQGIRKEIGDREGAKREKQSDLDFAIRLGFALQQIGFVIVLLAGLVHQHRAVRGGAEAAASEPRDDPSSRL